MYFAWKLHNIPPSVYYNYGCGEKAILSTFLTKEIEEINKSRE